MDTNTLSYLLTSLDTKARFVLVEAIRKNLDTLPDDVIRAVLPLMDDADPDIAFEATSIVVEGMGYDMEVFLCVLQVALRDDGSRACECAKEALGGRVFVIDTTNNTIGWSLGVK